MAAERTKAENAKKVRKKHRWTKDDTELSLLALPTFIWYALFCYIPMFGIIIAFKDFKIHGNFISSILQSKWSGLDNFTFLFSSNDIWTVIRNTLAYNIVFIALGVTLAVSLSILISQLYNKRLAKAYQTAMFLPYFLSWVVVEAVVWAFLSYDKGLINNIIAGFNGQRIMWYMEEKYWPFILVFLSMWKGLGNSMVVYLAAITGIDKSLYEAGVIDGASKWQQTRFITLPMMKTVIIIMFILAVGGIFHSDFGLFYQVPKNSNALFDVTYTIDVYVYSELQNSTTGMASATAFIQSIVSCLAILGANWVVTKVDPDSAMI
jgi:ABC-type polysaccharide transport system, permease component